MLFPGNIATTNEAGTAHRVQPSGAVRRAKESRLMPLGLAPHLCFGNRLIGVRVRAAVALETLCAVVEPRNAKR
jgi:hypothetical protein